MVHAMRMNSAPEAIKRLWTGACNENDAMRMNSAPEAIKRLRNGACNEDDAMRMNSAPEAIKRGNRPPLRALTCGIAPT